MMRLVRVAALLLGIAAVCGAGPAPAQTVNSHGVGATSNNTLSGKNTYTHANGVTVDAGGSASTGFNLEQRTQITTLAVPTFYPTASNATEAFDLLPNGSPTVSAGHDFTWADICDTDVLGNTNPVNCAHIAARTDAMELGSTAIYGATAKPVVLTFNGTTEVSLGASGVCVGTCASNTSGTTTLSNYALTVSNNASAPAAWVGGGGAPTLQVVGTDGATTRFLLDTFGTGSVAMFSARTARGTNAAPTAVQSADILGELELRGYNGSAWSGGAGSPAITAQASENWSSGHQGSEWTFFTVPTSSATSAKRLTITNDGTVAIGNATAALATNATGGFLGIPSMPGTPSGTPSVSALGAAIVGIAEAVYDTTHDKFCGYDGSAWHCTPVGAADLSDGVTGTGAVVRATSPTLATPNLGTPSALDCLHCTDVTVPWAPARVSGNWYSMPFVNANNTTIGSTTTAYFAPLVVLRAITVQALGVFVVTGQTSSHVQLAIYPDNGAGAPSTGSGPLASTASISTTTSLTNVNAAITATTLAPGLYWAAIMGDTASVAVAASANQAINPTGWLSGASTQNGIETSSGSPLGYSLSGQTYGTWPTSGAPTVQAAGTITPPYIEYQSQ